MTKEKVVRALETAFNRISQPVIRRDDKPTVEPPIPPPEKVDT
jgi:hypothetical protein